MFQCRATRCDHAPRCCERMGVDDGAQAKAPRFIAASVERGLAEFAMTIGEQLDQIGAIRLHLPDLGPHGGRIRRILRLNEVE